MANFRLNHSLLFVLISAFLTMQWNTTHVHLAEHHTHNGSQHQHSIKTHAHQFNHHTDAIDSAPLNSNVSVIELDHQYNAPGGKNQPPSTTVIADTFQALTPFQPIDVKLETLLNTKLSYLGRSTVYLRAPPRLS